MPVATRPIFGTEPRDLSLLFVLFYIAASGDEQHPGTFERNFNTRNGAQMWRLAGGSQLLALRIARRLGGRVLLGSPVERIVQQEGGVTAYTAGLQVQAKRAIVAIPPTLAGRIEYRPRLPTERDQLTQRLPQGTLIKVTAVYNRPFWRDAGLNGTAVSYEGPANVTFDDSPQDGSSGVIFGFAGGDEARRHRRRSMAARRAAVLANFTTYFGAQAAHPRAYFETDWTARSVDAWMPGGDRGARDPARLRPGAPQAGREHPLGGNGDVDLLERLHGRRGSLSEAGRARGARSI